VLPVIIPEVISFLGRSRCSSLMAANQAWCGELQALRRKRQAEAIADKDDDTPSLLRALSAPHFSSGSTLEDEDRVFETIEPLISTGRLESVLTESYDIRDYADIYTMLRDLQHTCQVSPACLEVLLAPRFERRKTTLLAPQPLHFAVVKGSLRTLRLLLRAGDQAGLLPQMLEPEGPDGPALSPLFFALLCGRDEVVRELLQHRAASSPSRASSESETTTQLDSPGSEASEESLGGGVLARSPTAPTERKDSKAAEVDIAATQRLQKADLWVEVRARMEALAMRELAIELESAVVQKQEQVARLRASLRAALLS